MFGRGNLRDPARLELSQRIAERDEAAGEVEAARSAYRAAHGMLTAATDRRSAAKAALAEWRHATAERVLSPIRALGADVAELSGMSAKEAREAQEDAADECGAGQIAVSTAEAHLAGVEADLRTAQRRVEQAAAPILASKINEVADEVEELHEQLEDRYAVLTFLRGMAEPGSPEQRRIIAALPRPMPGVRPPDYRDNEAVGRWRLSFERLCFNAASKLPT